MEKKCSNCRHYRIEGTDMYETELCVMGDYAVGFDGVKCYEWELNPDENEEVVVEE